MTFEAEEIWIVRDQGGFFFIEDGELRFYYKGTTRFMLDLESKYVLELLAADLQSDVQELLRQGGGTISGAVGHFDEVVRNRND